MNNVKDIFLEFKTKYHPEVKEMRGNRGYTTFKFNSLKNIFH